MCGPGGSLNGVMGAQIEVVLERVGHIFLHQCAWQGIPEPIRCRTPFGKKADMMALLAHHDGEFDLQDM